MTTPHRIVVTGANGQLGWELMRALQPLGLVVPLSRADLDIGDVERIDAAMVALRPTIICNAAAYTAVDRAESDAELANRVNGLAPGRIGAVAHRLGAAVVHFSTDYVFDGASERSYTEADTPNPLNVYGQTKLAGEKALAESGAAHLTLRTSWVYSTRGTNFLQTIRRLARTKDTLRVVNDQHGTPTWARWLAEATAQILGRTICSGGPVAVFETQGGVVHVTGAGETTWHQFASAIVASDAKLAGRSMPSIEPITTQDYAAPARRPLRSVLDARMAQQRFGLTRTHWMDQLRLALDEGTA